MREASGPHGTGALATALLHLFGHEPPYDEDAWAGAIVLADTIRMFRYPNKK